MYYHSSGKDTGRNGIGIDTLKKSQDKRNYVVDFSKVKKLLKFKPQFSIEFGIREILSKIKTKPSFESLGNYKII